MSYGRSERSNISNRRKKYTTRNHSTTVTYKFKGSINASITKKKPNEEQPYHTKFSFILIVLALIVIGYLATKYINSSDPFNRSWASVAFIQLTFGIIGLFGTELIKRDGFIIPLKFRPFEASTVLKGIMLAAVSLIIQYVTAFKLSIENVDRAYYFIFAAVCEEIFFRGFIMEFFFKFMKKAGLWIAVAIQAVFFTAMHTNYYNNYPALLSVFIGGLVLGIIYAIWRDITANILGHFLLNILAAISQFGILTLLMMA